MAEIKLRWMDSNGNSVDGALNESSATAQLESLINCTYCRDCESCTDCSSCDSCVNCTECTGCYDCHDCVGLEQVAP